jgi:hypothetical protein
MQTICKSIASSAILTNANHLHVLLFIFHILFFAFSLFTMFEC